MIDVKHGGAKGDGETDDGPAIRAALESGATVYLPGGEGGTRAVYRVVGDLVITNAAHIIGDGGAFRRDRSRVRFEGGSLIIKSNDGDAAKPSGSGTRIVDIAIEGDPQHAAPLVRMDAPASIEHSYLLRSGGGGVFVDGRPPFNTNGWSLAHLWIEDCAGWGVEVEGSDSQAALATDVHVITSGGGIHDGSFLGCTWVGCHTEYCHELGGYLCDGAAARGLFLGCYCESDGWAASWIGMPAIVIGGTLSAAMRTMPTTRNGQHRAWWMDAGQAGGMTWVSATGARKMQTQVGLPVDGRTVLAWQDRSAAGGDPHDFGLISDDAGKAYWFARARSSNLAALGWTRAGHPLGYDQALAPNGVHVGKATARGKVPAVLAAVPLASAGVDGDCVIVAGETATLYRRTAGAWTAVPWLAPAAPPPTDNPE